MDFSSLQTEVFRRVEEDSASPAFFSLVDVKAAINEGFEDLSEIAEWRERSVNLSLFNTVNYDLSTTVADIVLTVTSVKNNQTNRFLEPYSYKWLDRSYPRWEAVTGEPEKFWPRGIGNWLGMFPNKGASSGTVKLYYTAMPDALSADGDTPGFPQEFHLALVDYAVYDLLCQDREYDKAMRYWQSYSVLAESLRRFVIGRSDRPRLHRAGGVGY